MSRQDVLSYIYGSNFLFAELAWETVSLDFFKSYC